MVKIHNYNKITPRNEKQFRWLHAHEPEICQPHVPISFFTELVLQLSMATLKHRRRTNPPTGGEDESINRRYQDLVLVIKFCIFNEYWQFAKPRRLANSLAQHVF